MAAITAGVLLLAAKTQAVSPFLIATNYPPDATTPMALSAAFDGVNFLVGIEGDATASYHETAQLISPTGSLIGSRISIGRGGGVPWVAFDGTNYFMVWADDATYPYDAVYGQFVSKSGALVRGPLAIKASTGERAHQNHPVAFDGSNYLVIWEDARNGASNTDVYGQFVSRGGSLVGAELPICTQSQRQQAPTLAFRGTSYLVVWDNQRNDGSGLWDIQGRSVSKTGTLGTIFQISQTASPSWNPPSIASDGTNFMVVWNRDLGPGAPSPTVWDIYGRVVTPAGSFRGNEFPITTSAGNQIYGHLSFDGANYLVGWYDEANLNTKFRFFTPTGQPSGQEFYVFASQGLKFPFAMVAAFDGQRFLAVGNLVEDTNFLNNAIYGAFVPKSGPPDTAKPTLSIVSPAQNARLADTVIQASGTARDNVAVATVWCRLNNSSWALASSGNLWTNWSSVNLPLLPGTNTVQAYAVDSSGNLSTTTSVTFVSVQTTQPTVLTNLLLAPSMASLAVNPALNKIYVSGGQNNAPTTFVVDGATFSQKNVGAGWGDSVDPTNNNYWAAGVYSGTAIIRAGATDATLVNLPLGYCPMGTDLDAPHRRAWVVAQCGAYNDPIWAINADTYAVIAGPIGSGGVMSSILANPATGRAYVFRSGSGGSLRLNPPSYAVTHNSFGQVIGVNAAANLLYAVGPGGTLQIIDGAPDPEVVLTTVTLPFQLLGYFIGVNPVLNRIYVGNVSGNSVVILDATTGQTLGTLSLGATITGVGRMAVDTTRNRVYALAYAGSTAYLSVIQDNLPVGPVISLLTTSLSGPNAITTDGAKLYVSDSDPAGGCGSTASIVTFPLNGGPRAVIYTQQVCVVSSDFHSLAVNGANLYWIDPNGDPDATAIFRVPTTGGGSPTKIYSGFATGQPIVDGCGLATDGVRLYTADYVNGRVHRMNFDGSGITQLGPERYSGGFGNEHWNRLTVSGDTVYVVDQGKEGGGLPQVVSISTNGGAAFTTLWTGSPFVGPRDIAVGNGNVYVADPGAANTIWILPITGGEPTALVSGAPFINLAAMTLVNDTLYVTDDGYVGTNKVGLAAIYRVATTAALAPSITSQPQSLIVTNGKPAVFSVTASGTDPLAYQWQKNGVNLATSTHISGATTRSLTINQVTSADAGRYSVVVSNAFGRAASSNSVLTIFVPDTAKPTLAVVNPAANARLTNAVIQASGTARDNVAVAAIWCRLNNSSWALASTSDLWTNWWTAYLTLLPGTNTLHAYAVDTSGNLSTTSRVAFVYAPLTQPTVLTNLLLAPNMASVVVNPALNKVYVSGGQNSTPTTFVVDGTTFSQKNVGAGWGDSVDPTNNNYWAAGVYSATAIVRAGATDATVTNLSLGYCPMGTDLDAPHRRAWVVAQCGGNNDPIWAINADTYAVIAGPIGSGGVMSSILANPATGRAYVYRSGSGGSIRLNPPSYAVTHNSFGQVIGVNPTANLLYAVGPSGTLQIIDGAPDPELVLTTVTLPFQVLGYFIGVNPVLNRIYVGNVSGKTVAILDATSGQGLGTASLGATITGVGRIAVDATRNRVYAIAYAGSTAYLSVIQDNIPAGPGVTAPSITSQPQNLTATNGNPAVLSVTASGTLPLNYQWQRNGVNLANSTHLSGATTGILTINQVTPADAGRYSVLVRNLAGTVASSNAVLTVFISDTNKPTITIVSPAQNARLTNAVATVSGKASDNAAVAAVWYQLNDGAWGTANGTTNWITPYQVLTPGTNILRACAVDVTGNWSVTNTVKFVYVAKAPLTVQFTGRGTVSPNYNGQWLELGKAYTMTASAGSGFAFANWSGSLPANTPKLTFLMTSNLTLIANFVDAARPVNIITYPAVNQRVTNSLITATGKASDNVGVSGVWCQLNGAGWGLATTANRWTNWTVPDLGLITGTNLLQAFARDAAGNVSLTNSVKFTCAVTNPMFPIDVTNHLPVGIGEGHRRAAAHVSPAIAFDGTNFLVAYDKYNNASNPEPVAQLVSPTGTLVGPRFGGTGRVGDAPNVSFDGTNYLLAWTDYTVNGSHPIYGQFLDRSATGLGTPFPISQSTSVNSLDAMAFGGGSYLLVWTDVPNASSSNDERYVYGRLLSTSGAPVGNDFLISSGATQGAAAFDGANFLVTWRDDTHDADIYGRFISPAGAFVGDAFLVDAASTPSDNPGCVVFDGQKYLVAINNEAGGKDSGLWAVFARFVQTDGTVSGRITLAATNGSPHFPFGAFDGTNYLFTWTDVGGRGTNFVPARVSTKARFFDRNGGPVGPEFTLFPPQGSRISVAAPVLFDGKKFFAATEYSTIVSFTNDTPVFTNGAIYGVFVTTRPNPAADWAPASLSGWIANVRVLTPQTNSVVMSFGDDTFAQMGFNTNIYNYGVGDYTYSKLDTNKAQFAFAFLAPPFYGTNPTLVNLTFTRKTNASFTYVSHANTGSGTMTLSRATFSGPASLAGKIFRSADATGQYTTIFDQWTCSTTDHHGNTISSGTYTFTPASPVVGMVQINHTDPASAGVVTYVESALSSPTNGRFFQFDCDSLGSLLSVDMGTFTLSNPTNTLTWAPDSWSGLLTQVTPDGQSPFSVCFGATTFGHVDFDTNNGNYGVGDYTYSKFTTNTAQLTVTYTAPPTLAGHGSTTIGLTFTSAFSTLFIAVSPHHTNSGTISLSAAPNTVPASLAGKTVHTVDSSGDPGATMTFNSDGTFTETNASGQPSWGTYTFTPYSPVGALLQQNYTNPDDSGAIAYAELTFSSPTIGSAYVEFYTNPAGPPHSIHTGTFTIP